MYTVLTHGELIADKVRTGAYPEALRSAVTSDSAVLDIGTGTGFLALLACQFGARRVYAVEPADVIELAREIARANGYSDRIEFIQDLSTNVTLPEKVDVIVSDLHGVLPFFQHHIPAIIDARRRLLKPGGKLIPACETVWVSVADAPELYRYITNWEGNGLGLNLSSGQRVATNNMWKGRVRPEELLGTPKCWATLDYTQIESPNVAAEIEVKVERSGTGYGLSVWFDSVLGEGIGFSNGPGHPETIFGSLFFPWSKPIPFAEGDIIRVRMGANLVDEDYIFTWDTVVLAKGKADKVKADFRQSTFFGTPLSAARLRKRAAHYLPEVNEEGEIDRFVLVAMKGKTSSEQIARELTEQFPARFTNVVDALTRVGELAVKYSR
jgi:protein arginine N-methyltransferase 1